MPVSTGRHKLSRKRDQRRALIKGLAESLIEHESIVTTRPKAKALRPYIERLITQSKTDGQHQRRIVRSKINTNAALDKLFSDLGPRYKDRAGGYTRIESLKPRRGDNADMARISFVSETQGSETEEESQIPQGDDAQTTDAPTKNNDNETKDTKSSSAGKNKSKQEDRV